MKYLFEYWNKLKGEFIGKSVVLFLDYDGTLASIAETPDKAVLSSENRRLLERLARSPWCKIVIISGRALKDIKEKIGIPGIVYVGNHGLEIEGPKIKFKIPISIRYKRIFEDIKDGLWFKLNGIHGAFVEDKGLSLSLHYRLAESGQIVRIKRILHEVTTRYAARDEIKIKSGKKVFEIRPALAWDKGKVALWLLARWRFSFKGRPVLPIYIGDDATDEDAFKALKKYLPAGRQEGLTIFVGNPKKSGAQYYLKNTQEVKDFLNRIVQLP